MAYSNLVHPVSATISDPSSPASDSGNHPQPLMSPCAAYILRLKATALAFTSAALVLMFENINAVLFFKRSAVATETFGQGRIKATLAGAQLIICGMARARLLLDAHSRPTLL